ncbi:MAG TPA: hypothetical protein VNM91_02600 [Dehalococcoidia bacterium]|nr:hypothetical protein [Dehalococcoidia bacterium]
MPDRRNDQRRGDEPGIPHNRESNAPAGPTGELAYEDGLPQGNQADGGIASPGSGAEPPAKAGDQDGRGARGTPPQRLAAEGSQEDLGDFDR